MNKKLTTSRTNVVIAGVLGGFGEYLNIDPTIIRVLYVIGTFFTGGAGIPLYIILMFVIPSGGRDNGYRRGRNARANYYNQRTERPRKEAEKVDDESEWSDF